MGGGIVMGNKWGKLGGWGGKNVGDGMAAGYGVNVGGRKILDI